MTLAITRESCVKNRLTRGMQETKPAKPMLKMSAAFRKFATVLFNACVRAGPFPSNNGGMKLWAVRFRLSAIGVKKRKKARTLDMNVGSKVSHMYVYASFSNSISLATYNLLRCHLNTAHCTAHYVRHGEVA